MQCQGHRLGMMEIDSALVSYPAVAEAAVISCPDAVKGEDMVAFVALERRNTVTHTLKTELKQNVVGEIGAITSSSS